MPFRIKPDFGQVSENGSEPSSSESWDVFDDHPSGPNCANDPSKIVPKTGPLACESCTLASDADVLAGEAAADEIDAEILCVCVLAGTSARRRVVARRASAS
jgi:hypothetical protein